MKKITLIATLLLISGVVCFGQSFELYEPVGSQDVRRQNGEVLIREGVSGVPLSQLMKVKNVSAAACSVFCKKVYLQLLPDSDNTFCWDVCYTQAVMVSKKHVLINSQEVCNRFDSDYESNNYSGDSRIRYVWFDGNKPSDSVCIEVIFRTHPTGMDEGSISSNELVVSPNPANAYFKLNWKPTGSPVRLVLHDILGTKLFEKKAAGHDKEMNINVADYPDGLYFCMLESDGQVRVVKKIIIRH
jgi:hypothetical protein